LAKARRAFDPYLDARRFGKVPKDLRGLALGKLCAVEIVGTGEVTASLG
jgi:hypothetical protein